ncbi:MAG: cytochrome c oxidase assembly factor Coa1 family protein [Pseudoxanthomonas sp.]
MNTTLQQQSPGWWRRNWKWFVPMLAALLLTLFVGAILAFMSAIFGMIKSSDAYQQPLQRAQRNPAVIAALGEPIEPGWLVMGNINVNGPSGDADLQIPLIGSRASGDLFVEAKKSAGAWRYQTLVVQVDDGGERIDLLEEQAAAR